MSYASAERFAAQTAHLDLDTPDDIPALLQRASADLDSYLQWPMPPDPDPDADPPAVADRIDTAKLTWWARDCLARAWCAQAAYRCEIGEDSLVEGKPRTATCSGRCRPTRIPTLTRPRSPTGSTRPN